MKRLLLLITFCVGIINLNATQHDSIPSYRKGQVIVKYKQKSGSKQKVSAQDKRARPAGKVADDFMQQIGVTRLQQLMTQTSSLDVNRPLKVKTQNGSAIDYQDLSSLYILEFNPDISVEEVIRVMEELDDVEYAEPNYIVKAVGSVSPMNNLTVSRPVNNVVTKTPLPFNDPMVSNQWGLEAINMPALLEKPIVNSKRPIIAILDTGVDITHPDLATNIWTNESELGNDEDGNGLAGDVHGWNFVYDSPDLSDSDGHGTCCAGIAAAVGDNGIGIVGANPNALIMPVCVLDGNGFGDNATILRGIDYALANGADIISMSLGYSCTQFSQSEYEVLEKASKECIIVAAAGNDNICMVENHQTLHGNTEAVHQPFYPAAYEFVIGVQATDKSGELASFSNFDCGVAYHDIYGIESSFSYEISAPGEDILTTLPKGDYGTSSGTSMACPLVAGALSRLMQVKEFESMRQVSTVALATSEKTINVLAAYNLNKEDYPKYNIGDVFVSSCDGVDITFKMKGNLTLQVGEGKSICAIDNNYAGSLNIPSMVDGYSVTAIGYEAFGDCSQLTSVTLPESLTTISARAFRNCTMLTNVKLPANVSSLGHEAFGCTGIKNVVIPKRVTNIVEPYSMCDIEKIEVEEGNPIYDSRNNCNAVILTHNNSLVLGSINTIIPESVEKIGRCAFQGNPSLETIFIPGNVKRIGTGAFSYTGLKSIHFSEGTEVIENLAFCSCDKLTEIVIPKSVVEIQDNVFIDCPSLDYISVEEGNPVYDSRDNCNAIISTSTNILLMGCNTTSIPSSVVELSTGAFRGRTFSSIIIPDGVKTIGWSAFYVCTNLKTVEIPSSIVDIEGYSFGSTNLESIVIPQNVENIGPWAFYECNELTSVAVDIETPLPIDECTFSNRTNAKLYVPKGCKKAYEAAEYWNEFKTIEETTLGDVTGDGAISGDDVTALKNILLRRENKGLNPLAADLTGDGKMSIADITALINIISKR